MDAEQSTQTEEARDPDASYPIEIHEARATQCLNHSAILDTNVSTEECSNVHHGVNNPAIGILQPRGNINENSCTLDCNYNSSKNNKGDIHAIESLPYGLATEDEDSTISTQQPIKSTLRKAGLEKESEATETAREEFSVTIERLRQELADSEGVVAKLKHENRMLMQRESIQLVPRDIMDMERIVHIENKMKTLHEHVTALEPQNTDLATLLQSAREDVNRQRVDNTELQKSINEQKNLNANLLADNKRLARIVRKHQSNEAELRGRIEEAKYALKIEQREVKACRNHIDQLEIENDARLKSLAALDYELGGYKDIVTITEYECKMLEERNAELEKGLENIKERNKDLVINV
jgi:chromosome segregation ATPase